MDLDGMDYDDLLFILKKEKICELFKKYQKQDFIIHHCH
jgi:hypothetical protein